MPYTFDPANQFPIPLFVCLKWDDPHNLGYTFWSLHNLQGETVSAEFFKEVWLELGDNRCFYQNPDEHESGPSPRTWVWVT